MRGKATIVVLLVLGLVAMFGAIIMASQPIPMGSDGNPLPAPTISWTAILSFFGSGSIIASFLTLYAKIKPILDVLRRQFPEWQIPNFPDLPLPPAPPPTPVVPVMPVSPASQPVGSWFVDDAIAIVTATMNYAKHRNDPGAARAWFVAVMTELQEIAGLNSPAVAAALNVLANAIMSVWFPAPRPTIVPTPAPTPAPAVVPPKA